MDRSFALPSPAHRAWLFGIVLAEVLVLAAAVWGGALGAALLSGGLFFAALAFARPGAAWLLAAALTAFSVEILLPGTGSAVQAPTEPVILILEGIWLLLLARGLRLQLPPRALAMPVAATLLLVFLSCLYSAHRADCLKASLNLLWYVVFGLFLAPSALRDEKDFARFAAVFSIPGALVAAYYLVNIARAGLTVDTSNEAALPFFTEHGTFAAYLCFALPMAVLNVLWSRRAGPRFLFGTVTLVLFAGILLSLTRAAWLGFLAAAGTALYYSLRSRRGKAMAVGVMAAALAIGAAGVIRSTSALSEQAQSITNVKTNISNLERFNRWAAAWDMFRAHPAGGVGFGVYKHHYYEFRRVRLATTESGPRAGAHSLYLSILSETGVAGALVAIFFVTALLSVAGATLRRARSLGPPGTRVLQMTVALLAGLASYAVHNLFNYYPSSDKVALPFWAFVGALAVCAHLVTGKRTEGPACFGG